MSPSLARADGFTSTKSLSKMPRPIMLSPETRRKKQSSLGTNARSSVMNRSRFSGMSIGSPAAIFP